MDADCKETRYNSFDAVINFGDGFIVGCAIDAANLWSFVFAESLEEIPVDYFKECTDFIHPAPNYALVAIVYKDSLNLILTAGKKKEGANVAIIPIFIKCGTTDSEFINSLNIGDKIVISGSDLSIGNHINSPYNKN